MDVTGSRLLGVPGPLILLGLAAVAFAVDRPFARFINPDVRTVLDPLAVWIDQWSTRAALALGFALGGIALVFPRLRKWRVHALTLCLAYAAEEVIVGTLKSVVGRLRPIIAHGLGEHLRAVVDTADTRSFPSGHAAVSTICAIVLAAAVRNAFIRILGLLFAVTVSLGRCYAGVHHLSDILAGAGIGWGIVVVMHHAAWRYRWPLEDWEWPRRHALLTLLATAVVVGYFVAEKVEPVDARTGAIARDLAMGTTSGMRTRTLLEPFMGLGVKVSTVPDLDRFAVATGIWMIGAAAALVFFLRRRKRALAVTFLSAVAVLAANAFTALSGTPRQTMPVARGGEKSDAPVVTATLHFHFGDPFDAKGTTREEGLARARALGFDFVQFTHHNRWTKAAVREGREWRDAELYAMEWTPGPLHCLVYNTKPEPADLGSRKLEDFAAVIKDVHAAGGVIVQAHGWRWDRSAIPGPEALIAAGIDGFEIENRGDEYAAEPIERRDRIRELVEEKGLLALGSNDDHGRRNQNWIWMRLPVDIPGTPPEAAVWNALKTRAPQFRIITLATDGPHGWPTAFWPPAIFVQYFREMRLFERASWLLWIGLLALLTMRRKPSAISTRSL